MEDPLEKDERSALSIVICVLCHLLNIILLPCGMIFWSFRVVNEYEEAIILRLGQATRSNGRVETIKPGVQYVVPLMDTFLKVDMRLKSINIPPQEVLTKDSVTCSVDAVIYLKVLDSVSALLRVEDATLSAERLAICTLRSVIGQNDLCELLQNRQQIDDAMKRVLDSATHEWGIVVERVEIKDVSLPTDMQRAMATEAQATRQARARIIEAQGEVSASESLKEAAEKISNNPAALQLRYLQTLTTISADKNSTVLFPLPMELLEVFKKLASR